jgi:hypothetical protein
MSDEFEIKSGDGVPAGIYRTMLLRVEDTNHDEFGVGRKFVFEVLDGDQKGGLATRITSPHATLKNAAGRLIAGITGTSLVPGTKIGLKPFYGRCYLVQVENAPSGNGTRVTSVIPESVSQ